MTTIRAYTTIEQSKKLAEILPIESADMWYPDSENRNNIEFGFDATRQQMYIDYKDGLPCWSLSALYALLPERTDISKAYSDDCVTMAYWCWTIMSEAEDECDSITETANYDNPVDACVEMVIKLKDKNLL